MTVSEVQCHLFLYLFSPKSCFTKTQKCFCLVYITWSQWISSTFLCLTGGFFLDSDRCLQRPLFFWLSVPIKKCSHFFLGFFFEMEISEKTKQSIGKTLLHFIFNTQIHIAKYILYFFGEKRFMQHYFYLIIFLAALKHRCMYTTIITEKSAAIFVPIIP